MSDRLSDDDISRFTQVLHIPAENPTDQIMQDAVRVLLAEVTALRHTLVRERETTEHELHALRDEVQRLTQGRDSARDAARRLRTALHRVIENSRNSAYIERVVRAALTSEETT